MLTKEEGGRHTPFFNGYRPQFYFRTTDVTGVDQAARGRRDGHAGRQHEMNSQADHADRHGRGPALRYPRGRPHRWRRRRDRRSAVASRRPAQSPWPGVHRRARPREQTRRGEWPEKIRIRLKSYRDHAILDQSAGADRRHGQADRRDRLRPGAAADREERLLRDPTPSRTRDSREHFEMRTHKRLIDIHSPTPKTIDSLMHLDLPAGVDIEIKLKGDGRDHRHEARHDPDLRRRRQRVTVTVIEAGPCPVTQVPPPGGRLRGRPARVRRLQGQAPHEGRAGSPQEGRSQARHASSGGISRHGQLERR